MRTHPHGFGRELADMHEDSPRCAGSVSYPMAIEISLPVSWPGAPTRRFWMRKASASALRKRTSPDASLMKGRRRCRIRSSLME